MALIKFCKRFIRIEITDVGLKSDKTMVVLSDVFWKPVRFLTNARAADDCLAFHFND